jgi:hypothetical protein
MFRTTEKALEFWTKLKAKKTRLADLISIGSLIVENYLEIQDLYLSIQKLDPYALNTILEMHLFNLNVMNFEKEATECFEKFSTIKANKDMMNRNSHQA